MNQSEISTLFYLRQQVAYFHDHLWQGEYLTVPQISFSHGSMLSIHSSEANEDIILDASRMSLSSGHKPPSGKPR